MNTCSVENCTTTEGKFVKGMCNSHYHKKMSSHRYILNKDRMLAISKTWAQANKEKRSESTKKYRENNTSRYLNNYYLNVYGITYEFYLSLCDKQNNVCAICKQEETNTYNGKIKRLAVDHNHTTGKIRGLLCTKCNVSIGNLNDSIDLLNSAISYLTTYTET